MQRVSCSACLFVYSIRTGKRRGGFGLEAGLVGGGGKRQGGSRGVREKKNPTAWCQLAALSRSSAKLKAKDSSRMEGGKKGENYQNQWKLLKMIMDLNLQFAPLSFQ